MATKIQQILETAPNESVLFSSWLSSQGLDARGQYAYMKSGWLDRISKGVYKIHGTEPSLFAAISSYNTQLSKSCVVGAYTALELPDTPITCQWGSLRLIFLLTKVIRCLRGY